MSAQLTLLPQHHLGVSSGTGSVELISDGQMFNSLNASTVYGSGTAAPLNDLMTTISSTISPNFWYCWKTNATSSIWNTPLNPKEVLGNLVLNSVGPGKGSGAGVIQKMAGLVVGMSYTVEVTVIAAVLPPLSPSHSVRIKIYNGSTSFSSYTAANGFYGTITTTFTAQTTNDIITVSNWDNVDGDAIIRGISVMGSRVQIIGAGNGQVICDLYQEEDIPLTLSVDDFKNVSEQVKSYSKNFNLPATKRNNQIFNNMFEITRADDGYIFNPYVKTPALLKQDGFIIFEGYLRLIDIKEKEGQISYNVNLYSEVVALADILKGRTFAQLEFSELEHAYNFDNIRESWQGNLELTNPLTNPNEFAGVIGATNTRVLKYPFIDWNHQLEVDASGNPVLPSISNVFRPCIRLKYLIQNIFAATNFNYTSSFFDSAEFDRLYMDFNWGAENAPVTFSSSHILSRNSAVPLAASPSWTTLNFNYNIPSTPSIGAEFGYASGVFTATQDGQEYTASLNLGFAHKLALGIFADLRVEILVNGVVVQSVFQPNVQDNGFVWVTSLNIGPLMTGDAWYIRANHDGVPYLQFEDYATLGTQMTVTTTSDGVADSTLLETLRGELDQWEFLKGIMTMFNLVSMVDEDNPSNILIEPYNDIFRTNPKTKQLDWTDKIDTTEMSLKPLTDLNKSTIFKFEEDDDDYTFMQYKKATSGHLYGSYNRDASTSASGLPTILEGTKEIKATPFAATVCKQLMSQYYDFVVPSIYAMNDDGESEGFENAPRILYEIWHSPNGVKVLTSCTYSVPAQNGASAVAFEDEFLQFSHLSDVLSISSTSKDFLFSSVQLFPGVGSPPIDNLYNTYWAAYMNELYNADTRVVNLKVNLSPSDINSFRFYDKVQIKNRTFRVNKIEYKPSSLAKVEFILIP